MMFFYSAITHSRREMLSNTPTTVTLAAHVPQGLITNESIRWLQFIHKPVGGVATPMVGSGAMAYYFELYIPY